MGLTAAKEDPNRQVNAVANVQQQMVPGSTVKQPGLDRIPLPRTEGIGTHSTTRNLLDTSSIPGTQGVILDQRTVVFDDIWQLSENAHTHPTDEFGMNSLLPSTADINILNAAWARNPNGSRPVSQILTGQDTPTIFRATGLWFRPSPKEKP
ncbi:MAG: hypothetical protein P8X74_19510 [Reinekea sp.]